MSIDLGQLVGSSLCGFKQAGFFGGERGTGCGPLWSLGLEWAVIRDECVTKKTCNHLSSCKHRDASNTC
jgi:hypothetical protein